MTRVLEVYGSGEYANKDFCRAVYDRCPSQYEAELRKTVAKLYLEFSGSFWKTDSTLLEELQPIGEYAEPFEVRCHQFNSVDPAFIDFMECWTEKNWDARGFYIVRG